ncbi:MAG TPA: SDR family NAD(P)-dependent oxidoreductase [Reyranellaceae bacterium]|nr:SDR family NAD(P)-dependent oxidoreductase [Reyranellaceae bacterium]
MAGRQVPPAGARIVVITGASSGIARATALAFAHRGDSVILCARNAAELEEVARECLALGAEAVAVPGDMADVAVAETVRRAAIDRFGRIDVWVNAAAVLSLGRFVDISPETVRRVVETNVLGYANGAREALKQFADQGERGTLISLCSLLGVFGEPYVAPYVASKFAIRGLNTCLRQEARRAGKVEVCLVLPPAIDTGIYLKAGNVMGVRARSIVPVYGPERVARAIVSAADRPRREIVVGAFGKLLWWAERLAPALLERAIGRFAPALQFENAAAAPSEGNVFAASAPYTITGGWRAYWLTKMRALLSRR